MKNHKVKNPRKAGSLEKDKPIQLGVKTLKRDKNGACTFFENRMRGGVVKVMPFQVGEKALEGKSPKRAVCLRWSKPPV